MSTVAPNSSNSLVRGTLPMPAAWWRAARSSYLASTCTKMETVLGIHLQGTTLYKNVQQLKASNKFPENINSSLEYHGLLDRGSEDKQHAYRPQLHLTASQEGDRLDQNSAKTFRNECLLLCSTETWKYIHVCYLHVQGVFVGMIEALRCQKPWLQQKPHWGGLAQRETASVFALTHLCHVCTTLRLQW